jgi:hypothetical protein
MVHVLLPKYEDDSKGQFAGNFAVEIYPCCAKYAALAPQKKFAVVDRKRQFGFPEFGFKVER